MAQNTYIQQTSTQTTPSVKRKKKVIFKPLKYRRFQLAWGFFLLFWAFYLLLAFISYLFTAQADQSLVEAYNEIGISEAGEEVENWLGIYGAVLSYYFIYRWFGLGAFLLIPLLVNWSFRWLFKAPLMPTKKIVALFIFAALWLSTLLGYVATFMPQNSFLHIVAGVTGFAISQLLSKLLGVGTILLLIVLFLIFVVYTFNVTQFALKPSKQSFPSVIVEKQERELFLRNPINTATSASRNAETASTTSPNNNFDFNEDPESEDELEKAGIVLINKATGEIIKDTKKNATSDQKEAHTPTQHTYEKLEKLDTPTMQSEKHYIMPPVTVSFDSKKALELEIDIPKNSQVQENTPTVTSNNASTIENTQDEHKTLYDPRKELTLYRFPTLQLLQEFPSRFEVNKEELENNKNRIITTLSHYGINIASIKATIGPTVTLYEIVPDAGVRISKIKSLEDDIALSLSALGIRIIAPIPGKGTIGIEVPNQKREIVGMRSLLASEKFRNTDMELPIAFGRTISNEIFMIDLTKMPHLLIAGATGQGKSVCLNVILTSLLYKKHPAELKFVLIDPKKVELSLFNKIEKHFLAKLPNEEEAIITDTSKVINTLNSLCIEMDNRYSLLKEASCRNIKEYNQKFKERKLNPQKGHRFLPYIVLIIDELADLMITAGKEVEQPIARLAQLARAIGIHLVVATQRPSVNVITGVIKANFPARISFRVSSKIDSRTILDTGGAEQLIGMGDMLFSIGSDLVRVQCAFVDTLEVENICDFIALQQGYATAYLLPEYVSEANEASSRTELDLDERDELFEEAARIVVMHQQGSTSLLQRRLKLGYNRAGRIIDQLEKAGIVGPFEGSKAREVLIPDEATLEQLLKNLKK